ncbi:MAG: (Fe-S)-binding protein [Deltaproteobacteria bacterium]|nr:(Fe-S)-binding protein [Deltaproteobacteria bacterium]
MQDEIPDIAFATQCPSGMTKHGAYEPSGLMYMARGIAQGDLKWNADLAKVLYSCTVCGYCDDFCQRGYRHAPALTILEELRRIIPTKLKPKAIIKGLDTLNVPKSQKLATLADYGVADVSGGKKAAMILFGDNTIISNAAKLKEIGHIIKKSGKKVGCFISEPLPPVNAALVNGGFQKELDSAVAEIDARLDACGAKKVIVYNPESLSVLKRNSKSGAEFISITRFCVDVLKSSKIKTKKVKLGLATYQDPCHLGRYSKEYTAPREIMKKLGIDLKEMWRTANNSLCCGAGGGVMANDPTLAKQYAANRWQEVKATSAKTLITACPFCNANLRQGKPKNVQIIDITSIVAQALGFTGKEAR